MFLWKLYWSQYDSQGLRVPRTCSSPYRPVDGLGVLNQRSANEKKMSGQYGTLLGFVHFEKWSRWTWPMPCRCFTKFDHFERSALYWFDQGIVILLINFFKLLKMLFDWTKWPQKTYDVTFSVYYQGFYDSSIFDNMTESVLDFLGSGSMNGSVMFSKWWLNLWLAEIWLNESATKLASIWKPLKN